MNRKMMIALLTALFAVSTPAFATSTPEAEIKNSDSIWLPSGGRNYSWRAVAKDEVLLWASPSRPYLVKIWRPTSSLRFANSIGVTSTGGRVTTFDQIIVDGRRLPWIRNQRKAYVGKKPLWRANWRGRNAFAIFALYE
jgi:hypothetical protein